MRFIPWALGFSFCLYGTAQAQHQVASSNAVVNEDFKDPDLFQIHKIGTYEIDGKILDIAGKDNAQLFLDSTFDQGIACFNKLGTDVSRKNAQKMTELRRSGELKFLCSKIEDQSVLAHANFLTKTIMFQQEDIKLLGSGNYDKIRPVESTLFHELVHLLDPNYGHGKYEYAYTCQECCFPRADSTQVSLQAACDVCRSDSKSMSPEIYLSNLMKLSHLGTKQLAAQEVRKQIATSSNEKRKKLIASNSKWILGPKEGPAALTAHLVYTDALKEKFGVDLKDPEVEKLRGKDLLSNVFYEPFKKIADIDAMYMAGDSLGASLRLQQMSTALPTVNIPKELPGRTDWREIQTLIQDLAVDANRRQLRIANEVHQSLLSQGLVNRAKELALHYGIQE